MDTEEDLMLVEALGAYVFANNPGMDEIKNNIPSLR
jgi:hypothetical protein